MHSRKHHLIKKAREILKPQTLELLASADINLNGWQILERWSRKSPEALKALESRGHDIFLDRLLEQQQLEQEILMGEAGLESVVNGLSHTEILRLHAVRPELELYN
ncbi:hypothetical protein LJC19_06895 [Oxalobacter sp. OttesenSCG-928-P03]|nr:hypothetical protein [Oxalobacter sp. OttesenSCG-928-P03]